MAPYRRNAMAVGILFIACSVASILSVVPLGSMLDAPDYLAQLAANSDKVVLTALIEFVWAATAAGIAIGLYPVIRRYDGSLALGSAAARTAEGMLVLVGTLSLLALLTLGEQSAAAGPVAGSSSQVVGDTLLAVRDWAFGFLGLLAFGIGALMYYYLLYPLETHPALAIGLGSHRSRADARVDRIRRLHARIRADVGQHVAQRPDRPPGDGPGDLAHRQGVRPTRRRLSARQQDLAVSRARAMTTVSKRQAPRLQPRWFIRSFWVVQRAVYSVTGGRLGLRTATADRWGMMRLRTVGRRTGTERTAILGYFEDGPNLVTMAMNGWADPSPPGGSTCRRSRTRSSTCPVAPVPCMPARPARRTPASVGQVGRLRQGPRRLCGHEVT